MALIAHWKFDKGLQNFFPKYNLNHGFKYNWYNTQDYYNSNGHPQNETEMNEYFNVQNTGIILGGTEFHYDNICFGSSGQITSWGDTTKAKPSGLPQEYYQFEAIGYIYIPESGTYEFLLDSDDASDFFINNTKVADFYGFNGGGHGFYDAGDPRNIYPIVLEEGVYSFKARLEEGSGGDGIQISWKKPGSNYFKTIPKEFYSHQEHENGKIGIQQRKTSGQFVSDLTDIPQNFSISMWYKHNGAVWTSECMFGTRTGSNGFMFYRNSSDSQGYYRIYFWYNATDGTIKSYYQWPGMSGFQQDTWYHIVMVRTQDGYLRFYRDGVLYLEKTPPSDFESWNNNGQKLSFHGQGNGSSYTGGDISFDDIKIYDHQLSYEEVKELSKQKILHYKMNTFEESTENLYGDISTSSILRPSRTIYEEETPTNSLYYKHTSGQLSSTWSGNSYGYSFKDIQIESGKKAQFTAWVYLSTDCDISSFPMSIEGATSTFTLEGIPTAYDMTKKGTWQRIGRGQVSDGNVRFLIYPRKLGVEDGSFSGYYVYGAIQVELKDHQTHYTPDIRNQLVLDSSGYDNHQELNLSYQPEWKDEEGIYGIGNYYFNNKPRDGSTFEHFKTILYIPKSFTFGQWIKGTIQEQPQDNIYPFGWANLCTMGPSGGTNDNRSGIIYYYDTSNYTSWNPGQKNLYDGNWHHWYITYNAKTGQLKQYIDGKLDSETTKTNLYHLETYRNFNIGSQWSTSYGGHGGNIQEIKVYQTQLSEQDIKELYYKKQQIDTNGNFYSNSFIEPKTKLLIKKQLKYIYDNTYNSIGNWSVEQKDLSEFVEQDYTLGNCYIDGQAYISSTEYYPARFELTRINNDQGVTGTFQPKNGVWERGWNDVYVSGISYASPSITNWSDMFRLEIYRSGPQTGSDTSQYIILKNIKINKMKNNNIIKSSINKNNTTQQLKFQDNGVWNGITQYLPLTEDQGNYTGDFLTYSVSGTTTFSNKGQYFNGTDGFINLYVGDDIPHENQTYILDVKINSYQVQQAIITQQDKDQPFHSRGLTIRDYGIEAWTRQQDGTWISVDYNTTETNKYIQIQLVQNEQNIQIYANGSFIASKDITGFLPQYKNYFKIGNYTDANYPFNGYIKNLKIYARQLTQSEIKQQYKQTINNNINKEYKQSGNLKEV